MKIITDDILHIFVRNAKLLDSELRLEIEGRLKDDEVLLSRIQEIKLFYKYFKSLNISRDVIRYCNLCNNILPLFPLKADEILCINWTKHAALHVIAENNVFNHFMSFISYDNNVMIRVQTNENDSECKLFLIMEDMLKLKKAKVMIEGYDGEFTPDEDGIIILKDVYIDENTVLSVKLND